MRCFHIPLAMSLLLIFNAMSTSAQDDNSAAMLLQKGDSCLNMYDNYHAMQYYLACANRDSTDITAHRKLALCYRNMGNSKACIESLARIPEDSISHEDARMYYYSFSGLNANDKATLWGEHITKLYPYDSEIVASLSSLYNKMGQPEKAEQTARRYMTDCDSMNLLVNNQLAYSLFLQQKYEDAITQYEKLITQGQDNYTSNFVLGLCYDCTSNADKAQEHLAKAITFDDDNSYCLYRLAMTEETLFMDSLAMEHFNRSIETAMPQTRALRIFRKLASLHYEHHEYADAARFFERCIAYGEHDNLLDYYNAAQMLIGAGDKDKANMYLQIFISKAENVQDEETKKLIVTARKQLDKDK